MKKKLKTYVKTFHFENLFTLRLKTFYGDSKTKGNQPSKNEKI